LYPNNKSIQYSRYAKGNYYIHNRYNLQEGTEEGTVLLLAGNKTDLSEDDDDRVVKMKDGARLADVRNHVVQSPKIIFSYNVISSINLISDNICSIAQCEKLSIK